MFAEAASVGSCGDIFLYRHVHDTELRIPRSGGGGTLGARR